MNVETVDPGSVALNRSPIIEPPSLWTIILSAAVIGPFVGGMPYLYWTIYSLVVAYAVGFIPAILGGTLFAFWLRSASRVDLPSAWKGGLHGAFFGSTGCGLCASIFAFFNAGGDAYGLCLFVVLHGLGAGFLVGGVITNCNNRRARNIGVAS